MSFSENFMWGAATAAYQIEGAAAEGGRGLSVWDAFSHTPGAIKDGATGDVACDHYHRWKEDVEIMRAIGLQAYRFSLSWSRLFPDGTGAVNAKGFDFYDRLIDALLEVGIKPLVTLFHWDLPLALHEKGGWLNPDSQNWFADYAAAAARRFGDRVRYWMTFNEMQIFASMGYRDGVHAPGLQLENDELLTLVKHILLAHGRGVMGLRTELSQHSWVGLAHAGATYIPVSNDPLHAAAARNAMFTEPDTGHINLWSNLLYLDPIFFGSYDAQARPFVGRQLPEFSEEDRVIVSQPIDFLGVNYYQGVWMEADDDGKGRIPERPPKVPHTAFDWPVQPSGLYWMSRFLYERYRTPIMITENGASYRDEVAEDGTAHDADRIAFLEEHLKALKQAARDGIPLLGYMLWSLMDNFEWAEGFSQRFGITRVDYDTQKRTIKASGRWYKDVILANGELL